MNPETIAELERLEAQEYRGQTVRAFLENTAVIDVFKSLEASYFKAWKESRDPAQREDLFTRASVLDEVKQALLRVAQSGDLATHELEALKRDTDQI